MATMTASILLFTPSFGSMFLKCVRIVWVLMDKCRAIWVVFIPRVASPSISSSRDVRRMCPGVETVPGASTGAAARKFNVYNTAHDIY